MSSVMSQNLSSFVSVNPHWEDTWLIRVVAGSSPATLFTLLFEENNNMKVVKKIIPISKKTAHKLNKEYGVPFGYEGISTSKTKNKKFYLCESKHNLSLLSKIEK